MEKNQFVLQLSEDVAVDLALMSDQDWKRIKNDTKFLMKSGHTKDPCKAYIAAFIVYLIDLDILSEPYDATKHKFV